MSVGVRTEEDDEGSARHPRVSTGTASGADPASGARVTTWPAWFVLGLMGVAGVWTAGGSRAAAQECRRECSATEIQSSDACCYLPPHLAPASDCARCVSSMRPSCPRCVNTVPTSSPSYSVWR